MISQRLARSFFARDTHLVAKQLLGKLLIRKLPGDNFIGRITEVEAYVGEDDLACHASRGKTPRTAIMYGPAGHAYVYLIYGMYYCFNIVTEKKDLPAAILIRGAIPVNGLPRSDAQHLLRGPGRITRAFHIDKTLNGQDLTISKKLYIADDGFSFSPRQIQTSPRINVAYAGPSALYPWRYFIQNAPANSSAQP